MDCTNLKERAADIFKTANFLSDELAQLGHPDPSFEQGLPALLHSDAPESNAGAARLKLLQMLDEFCAVLTEPTLLLTPELASLYHANISCNHLLMMTYTAQSIDQCALYCSTRHRREFSTSRNQSPRSC